MRLVRADPPAPTTDIFRGAASWVRRPRSSNEANFEARQLREPTGHPGVLRCLNASWTLYWRRIDLCDSAKAIGFGLMRPRNKCSAHFCAVPARYDTEPERLFRFDVTRRKILHEACFQESARSSIERWVKLSVVRRTTIGSALIREPGKVGKYGRDQIAMMGVGRSQAGGV
jgi:hypothetical protein